MDSHERPVANPEYPGYWLGAGCCWLTEEDARQAIQDVHDFNTVMTPIWALPDTLSRSQYETAAIELGIAQMADTEIVVSRYSVGNCPRPPESRLARFAKMALAARRLDGIEAERAAQPKPAPRPVRMVRCDCGHDVPEGERMSASLGTSCFDCYDRMSA